MYVRCLLLTSKSARDGDDSALLRQRRFLRQFWLALASEVGGSDMYVEAIHLSTPRFQCVDRIGHLIMSLLARSGRISKYKDKRN